LRYTRGGGPPKSSAFVSAYGQQVQSGLGSTCTDQQININYQGTNEKKARGNPRRSSNTSGFSQAATLFISVK
jgi:hypothetical protein